MGAGSEQGLIVARGMAEAGLYRKPAATFALISVRMTRFVPALRLY